MSIIHWIGIDDHADKWVLAHVKGAAPKPEKEWELVPDNTGFRRLVAYLKSLQGEVRVVYEAGPCGFDLCRKLTNAGIDCEVAAPTLTPSKPGQKVVTNRSDALKLAKALRSGDLTMVYVPDMDQESLRDLLRGRSSVQQDVGRMKKKIIHLLLRYGHRFRNGKAWTRKFMTWLRMIALEGVHSRFVLDGMIHELEHRMEQLRRFDDEIEKASKTPEYQPYIAAMRTLRGIDTLSAMVILSELGDLRRFERPTQLMAAIGLVPSEFSTGDKSSRFSITKTGNAHVRHIAVEAGWQYQKRITAGRTIKARRAGQSKEIVAIAERCEKRLNTKFHRMTSRGKKSTVAVVAVARELVGFIWAIGQQVHP